MAQRINTDDQVYQLKRVYLGPVGWSLPFHARYLAYGIFLATFPVIWLLMFAVGYHALIPVWPLSLTLLATKAVMQAVDHDLTLRALVVTARAEIRSRHRHRPDPITYTNARVDTR